MILCAFEGHFIKTQLIDFDTMTTTYPTYEDHRKAWEELAEGIAAIKNDVREELKEKFYPIQNRAALRFSGQE